MKNKNIKNKLQNVVDGFSCILDFSKFSGGGPPEPPYKGNTSIKPSKSFFNNNSNQRGEKELESPPSLKQSTRTLSLGYTEIRKPTPIKTIYKNSIFRLYRN